MSREEAIQKVTAFRNYLMAGNPIWDVDEVREAFDMAIEALSIDPVVRCKDCIHHKDAPKTTDVWCERVDGLLPKDWYCADGEREGEEE